MTNPGLKGWVATFTTNGAILFCGLATSVLAARLLLPAGRGEMAIVLFWPQLIAGIGCLSLNEAIVYRVGGTSRDSRVVLATGFWSSLALAGGVLALSYVALPHLLGSEQRDLLSLARLYLVLFLPFNFVTMSLVAVDQGLLDLKRFNSLRLVQPVLYLTALLLLWARGAATVGTVVVAAALAVALTGLLRLWIARHAISRVPVLQETKELLSRAGGFHSINLATFLAAQIDKLILIRVATKEDVGYYYAGFALASIGLGVVTQTVQSLIFPSLARLIEQSTIGEMISRSLRLSMLLLVSITVPLIIALPWLLPLLYGQPFAPAIVPGILLSLASIPKALRGIAGYGLRGIGVTRPQIAAEGAALLVFCVLALPAYRFGGIAGLALSLVAANVAALAPLLLFLVRRHGLKPGQIWGLNLKTVREAALILRREISLVRPAG